MNVPGRVLLRGAPALLLLAAACGQPSPREAPWAQRTLAGLDARQRAAQLVMVDMSHAPSGRDAPGGVLLRRMPLPADSGRTRELQSRSPVPLLVAVDLDSIAATSVREAAVLAPAAARSAAEAAAARARHAGATLGLLRLPPLNRGDPLAPLARDPAQVAAGFRAYLSGLEEGGLLSAAATLWTDTAGVPRLDWDRARLDVLELYELEAVVEEGVAGIGLGNVRLASLTGDSLPLPFSATAIAGVVRRDLSFEGVVFADVSPGSPLSATYGEVDAAVRAVAAGADMLVGVREPGRVVDALLEATRTGRLAPERLTRAAERVLELKAKAQSLPPPPPAEAPDREEGIPGAPPSARLPSYAWPPVPTLVEALPGAVGMGEAGLAQIDRALRQGLADSVFTAAAVAVGRRGGLVLLRGYGEVDGAPVEPLETVFDLASLSKVIATTTATALLVEDGEMALDAPVRRYLPEFQGEHKGGVRVRHLLTHTSGLPPGLWLFGSDRSARGALARVLEQPLRREPGRAMEYSDLGMILLAEAVERAAGMPIDRFLALRLFAPLGMQSTHFLPPETLRPRIVPTAVRSERDFPLHGVVHDANAFRLGGVAGHAGLFGTARDLAVFAQTMLNGGSYGTVRVLAPATVRTFTARQPGAEQRALGWDTPSARSSAGRFFSARSFGHTGFTGTSLWIDPEKELFVVLLTNRTHPEASGGEILRLRAEVHEAAARTITDQPVRPRPGAR